VELQLDQCRALDRLGFDMLDAERVNDFETPFVMRLASKRV
jgi:hypothetical protein